MPSSTRASGRLMTPVAAEIAPLAAADTRPRSPVLREFWHYFSINRGAVIGLVVFILLVLVAIFAPLLAPHAPDAQYATRSCRRRSGRRAASRQFLLGTDAVGRDILSRLIYGARFSLLDRRSWSSLALVGGIIARPARRLFPRLGRRADHARHGPHPGLPVAASGAGPGRPSSGPACSTPCSPSRSCCSRISRA